MKINITKTTTQKIKCDAMALFVTKANREKDLQEIATKTGINLSGLELDFKAKEGEMMLLYPNSDELQAKRVVCLGLPDKPTLESIRKAACMFSAKSKEMKLDKIAMDLSSASALSKLVSSSVDYLAQTLSEGAFEGCYEYNQLKTNKINELKKKQPSEDEEKHELKEIVLATTSSSYNQVKSGAETGEIITSAQSLVKDLINAPSNYMTATMIAEKAKESGKKHGYKVQVFDKAKLQKLGFGGLLAVNFGSANPPTFSILEYKPQGTPKAKIAILGKGVTFDTGGISIKPSENMGDMKADMSGGADVIGAVEAAARLKLPVHVIGCIPATDNKTGENAQNPGDVLTTYAGVTVEVDNTDAEGRLILSDALTYAKETYQPDVIIDLATLTGACIVALGNEVAGLFSNNDELAEKLFQAGQKSGEKVWRMPVWDNYAKQLKSDVADLKNIGGRGAGAITAAKFLEYFVGDHPAWAHLDIAGPAFPGMVGGSNQKGSTGFGVRLLVEFMRMYSK